MRFKTLISVAWSTLIVISASADTIYVNGTTGDDGWNGLCQTWDGGTCGPKRTIQAGIDAATGGDLVLVADGEYVGDGNREISFWGKSVWLQSENGPQTCVINCEDTSRAFNFVNGEGSGAIIDGLSITNGEAEHGAAIYCDGSSPTIRNSAFSLCGSYYGTTCGGAIYCWNASPTVVACSFEGCDADSGGSLYCEWASAPEISDCLFAWNLADNDGGAVAGVDWSDVYIEGCQFISNSARVDGGAVYSEGGSVELRDCEFVENMGGLAIGGDGGALCCRGGSSAHVQSCTMIENIGGVRGGAISAFRYSGDPQVTIVDCIIRGNRTFASETALGGAVYLKVDEALLQDCVIEENSRAAGGGVACEDVEADVRILNCILRHNTSDTVGGAIACLNGGTPAITNCLITGNSAPVGGGIAADSGSAPTVANVVLRENQADYGSQLAVLNGDSPGTLAISHCNVEGGEPAVHVVSGAILSWGPGNIDDDPLYAFPDADLHLSPGSPCIDAGTNAPPGGLPQDDLDGFTRVDDGDGDDNAVADIGPYEFAGNGSCVALSQTSFEFAAPLGGPNPADQYLYLRDCGGATLNWEITPDCGWLQPVPAAGASDGEVDVVALQVNVADLPHGDHVAVLTIDDPAAVNAPRTVYVLVHVYATLHVPSEYPAIQDAIDDAVDGDTIIVADGVYTGERNRGLDFGGRKLVLRSEGGPSVCIIDCEYANRGFYFHSEEGPDSIVSGFTIMNGTMGLGVGTGIMCLGSSPRIANCVIRDCITGTDLFGYNWGAGVYLSASSATFVNCVIVNNTAYGNPSFTRGGGVYCYSAAPSGQPRPTMVNCIIANNSSSGDGGGVGMQYSADMALYGCIVWNNEAPTGAQIRLTDSSTLRLAYSDVRSDVGDIVVGSDATVVWGPGNIDADPLFADPNSGDYHVLAGSPCFDAGANSLVPPDYADLDGDGDVDEFTPLDLDYEGRFFDDPNTPDSGCGSVAIVDMGAYEFGGTGPQPCIGDFDGDGDVDLSDLAALLGSYGSDAGGDLDCDGDTDLSDLAALLGAYGNVCP